MKKVTRFFWFCSGAHIDTLKKYPIEHNKYVGIGATIFFTALFAALSGGYAMYFVFSGSAFAVGFAILFGLLWGTAIFNMDRYIVSSINKEGTTSQQILQASPRILLAIMIGIVISRPLELKIFDKEIRQKLRTSYSKAQNRKIDTLKLTYEQKYSMEMTKNQDLKKEKDSLERDINRSRYQLNQEVFGDKTNQTSGITGYGTYAKQKEAVLVEKQNRLKTVTDDIGKMDEYLATRKQAEGLNDLKLFTPKQLDSLTAIAGFADRNWALGQLGYNDKGERELDTYLAISFIGYLFILFECLPVFVKLMSPKGPYDVAMAKTMEANIYYADKDKERDMSVTDHTYDHTLDEDIARRKRIITAQSDYDFERHRFD
ncbi:DUF4407 domain-containing protein [Mucilaginibacter myungsuensis]|uniref:DUF4407 domain-containing protein n=1 Tax=Mucilaginibacter myungsuensis TaxID=649104 RepID=A0A929L6B7_9SPHI|nr:DUF4407 domain-containing protein [Mucilaginibacter myungsuensis]MBE9664006.1 DUF4407 domain-containing protein [Mucilaginibacter myungsuensis]MDN3601185.1 DUF4407 domain-containing protein [Mucilaginibacter myungsuensis]